MEIQNKVALITGGAQRVGQAITLMLAKAGANVVINYNTSAIQAEATAETARALGVKVLAIQADLSQHERVKAMVAQMIAWFERIDILINNADRWEKSPFPGNDLGPWERVTTAGINGHYYITNAVAPLMLANGGGVIINMLDQSAWEAWPNFIAHAVAKSALLAMTRQFALELAPTIRVNAVVPGPILPPPGSTPDMLKRIATRALLNRWGTVEDVTQAVRFLIEADYITGETLFVDGGEHLKHR